MLEKFNEGLVRRTIIHLFQQLVDFGKEVAGAELVFAKAPDVAIYFCGVQVVAAKQVPNFRWFAVYNSAPSSIGPAQAGSRRLKMRPTIPIRASVTLNASPPP